MRLPLLLRVLPVLLTSLGLAGCGESWAWHQKMTVRVETPAGEKSASSVIQCRLENTEGWFLSPEMRGATRRCYGEAVVLEMLPGRYLFALLEPMISPFAIFFPDQAPLEVAGQLETLRETRMVPPKLYPMLVTFANVADPTSVTQANPGALATSFGAGVSLKSITLEITDEPATKGKVENILTWLGQHPEPKLGPATGGTTNIPFYRLVSHGDFLRR